MRTSDWLCQLGARTDTGTTAMLTSTGWHLFTVPEASASTSTVVESSCLFIQTDRGQVPMSCCSRRGTWRTLRERCENWRLWPTPCAISFDVAEATTAPTVRSSTTCRDPQKPDDTWLEARITF